ncbi:hypothetical protein B0H19DRAFT_70335 [Mycena capillaripes]|nr:hypothetical protein B0H19DRAFT_70335 [Mycena capillaripes]
MARTFTPCSGIYRLFFFAALFFRPAQAEIYVTGTPAIVIFVIILLLLVGGGATACFLYSRRKSAARKPQLFVPQTDQVPMLAPPQNQFTDAAAPVYPQNTGYPQNIGYPQNTGYAQNTGGYAPSTGPYNNNPGDPPSAPQSTGNSSVAVGAYPQAVHMPNAPAAPNQNAFTPPPGPPPVVIIE